MEPQTLRLLQELIRPLILVLPVCQFILRFSRQNRCGVPPLTLSLSLVMKPRTSGLAAPHASGNKELQPPVYEVLYSPTLMRLFGKISVEQASNSCLERKQACSASTFRCLEAAECLLGISSRTWLFMSMMGPSFHPIFLQRVQCFPIGVS